MLQLEMIRNNFQRGIEQINEKEDVLEENNPASSHPIESEEDS